MLEIRKITDLAVFEKVYQVECSCCGRIETTEAIDTGLRHLDDWGYRAVETEDEIFTAVCPTCVTDFEYGT